MAEEDETYHWKRRVYWRKTEHDGWIASNKEECTRIDIEVGGGPYIGSYTWTFDDVRGKDGRLNLYWVERFERMLMKAFEFGRKDAKAEIRKALGAQ